MKCVRFKLNFIRFEMFPNTSAKTKRFSLILSGLVSFIFIFAASACAQSGRPEITIKVPYKTKTFIGKPVAWDGKKLLLLRRDGRLSFIPVKSEKDFTKIKDDFEPYSSHEIRRKLQLEFGSKYQVSITSNFVVVHPPGSYSVWAEPFQKLYSRFQAYFSTRGFKLEKPEFPLIAVVLKSRKDFDKFLKRYHKYDPGILGYYSPKSNRIITYDQSGGEGARNSDWLFNAATIIHEATHQTAFNTGIHSRIAPVPRWTSEGLAMMFEAPGVNNSMYYSRLSDRINRDRLIALKNYYKRGKVKGNLAKLVATDNLFRTDPQLAYALSWGLTFYLNEKMPAAYQTFLRNDAKRSDFEAFKSKQRAKAFAQSFGGNLEIIEARMKRFIEETKVPSRHKQTAQN